MPTLNTYGRGPATRSATASTTRRRRSIVVTMADGSDDPSRSTQLAHLVERGVVVAAASRYMHGRPTDRRPALKRLCLAVGRPDAALVRAGRHPMRPTRSRRTTPSSYARSASSPTPASSSASSWSPRPAAVGCRSRRCRRSGSTGPWAELQSRRLPVARRGTCAGTAIAFGTTVTSGPDRAAKMQDVPKGERRMSKVARHRFRRFHRRLRRAGAARARPRSRRRRQPLEVRPRRTSYDDHPAYRFVEGDATTST